MISADENTLQTTDRRSLWSDTLLDMLYEAIENDWSANATREILFELQSKGYKLDKIVRKVDRKFGRESCRRLLVRIKT